MIRRSTDRSFVMFLPPRCREQGYILPPKVVVKELPTGDQKQSDCQNLITTIDDHSVDKILVCARSTKQIVNLIKNSDFCKEVVSRDYSWMMITSKTGAVIDGVKVSRGVLYYPKFLGEDTWQTIHRFAPQYSI